MSRTVQRATPEPIPPGLDPHSHRLWTLGLAIWKALDAGEGEAALALVAEYERLAPGDALALAYRRAAAINAFAWPAARSPREPGVRDAPRPTDVDLVAFHAELPIVPGKPRADYLEVLRHAFLGAAARAPAARRILLTDERTRIPGDLGAHEVIRRPIDLARLMYERMRVQLGYLEARAPDRCSVLMDTDVVTNRDPAAIFAEDFDVALTYRPESKDAPFNGGVILAGPGAQPAAFFARALACYGALAADPAIARLYPQDLRAWWGDQFALFAAVGPREFAARATEALEVDGVRVAFLPAAEYNFTLEPGPGMDAATLASKHFVHFKGNRKAALADYVARIHAGPVLDLLARKPA